MRSRLRTALVTKSTAFAVPADDADAQRALARRPAVVEHLERDVVREHHEEREHDDGRDHVSVPRAPIDDEAAEVRVQE